MRVRSLSLLLPLLAAAFANLAQAEESPAIPHFAEETQVAGIGTRYMGDWEFMVGGGAATFDCNTDGYPDLLLAGGTSPAGFYRNASAEGSALRFEKTVSGLELQNVTGAYPLDIDSDGNMDVVLLRVGENVAMRGLGECKFERANENWKFDGGDAWSTSLAATWERSADWPTIAIGNYIDRREEGFPWGSCTDNWLHRAEGSGFAPPLSLSPSYCTLSMLFTDWNRSGTPSLRVSNDREYYKGGQEQLWHVEPRQPPALYSADEGWKRLRIWGMGIAEYDLNFDGYPEYYLTSMADNKLQTLKSASASGSLIPDYSDMAFAAGVTAHRPYIGDNTKPSTAWHAQFEDVNNDGLADLFVAKGNVAEMPDFALDDPNNLLLQKPDGSFAEVGDKADVASGKISRGAALADFNLDGLIDLVVVNRWEPVQIWRNVSRSGYHWIEIRPVQMGINRDAIGGWIEVRLGANIIRREITVGGGHASGQNGWRHFGLGDSEKATLRIIWPDGTAGNWQTLSADKFYIVGRDEAARLWTVGTGH